MIAQLAHRQYQASIIRVVLSTQRGLSVQMLPTDNLTGK